MKKVITYGTFDLFHKGHKRILERAKEQGDYLIVGVTGEQYDYERGKLNVEEPLEKRIENVKKSGLADQVIVENHVGQKISDIEKYNIDKFIIGSDWKGKFDYLKEYCEVVYLERTKGVSSTQLRGEQHSTIRVGIVGAGRIANRFVPESKYVSGIEVVGVCTIDKSEAEKFYKKYELEFFTDSYDEMLKKVDAIYIATPHKYHYSYSEKALNSCKHVLCEKPITLKSKELKKLFEVADENNVTIMEAIKTVYSPGFQRFIEIAKSGLIGEIKDVEACFTKLSIGNIRELNPDTDGGSVNELATYPLAGIVKLLGRPEGVKYISNDFNGIDGYTKILLKYRNAVATAKVGLKVKSEGEMIVSGTKGYIKVPSPWWLTQEFEVCFEDRSKNKKFFCQFEGDCLRYEIAKFIKMIKKNKKESWKFKRENSLIISEIIEGFHNAKKNKTLIEI